MSIPTENARKILLARQRAEEELVRIKEALERRTRELARALALMRATLDSTTDGILATDGEDRIVVFNKAFMAIWRPPPEFMESGDHRRVLEAASRSLPDPAEFLARMEAIRAERPEESHDLLELSDGRVIERVSRLQLVDERGAGRVWIFRDVTERRRNEEAQVRLAALVESSDDAIVSKTLESRILSWNSGATRLFGYTAQEAVGEPITLLIPDDRQDEEARILERLRRGERIDHYDTVRLAKDGRRINVSLTVSPVLDDAGRVIAASSIARDVTGNKLAEQALRASESRFRLVAEMIPSMVWTAAADGAITWVNPRWLEFCGFDPEDRTRPWPELVLHPDDRERCREAWASALRDGTTFEIEVRNRRHDGAYRWFVTRAVPLRDAAGRIVQWFGANTDIEDRRHAEQISRFLADASAAMAELTDVDGTLQRVAGLAVPAFADGCAVDLAEAGDSIRRVAVIHADLDCARRDRELFEKYPPRPDEPHGLMYVLRTGRPDWIERISESTLDRLARSPEHLEFLHALNPRSLIAVPLSSHGRTLGVLSFVTAGSGRVYEAADLAVAEDLALRAVIAIENAHLLGQLKESDRRKDEFLAMLAHELRNPLAPIRNSVQILGNNGPLVPEQQWAAEVIDRQVHQMTRLIDDLLDVSRITLGKIELRKEVVDLSTIVQNAVESSGPLMEKLGHSLTVSISSEPIRVEADPARLTQVLFNLLSNAARYTDPGGHVHLEAARWGESAVIRVQDDGIGIPPEMLPHIFDLFTQVDRSRERSGGGLGIGLTLVQRLVEMHGGQVGARSEGLGRGSEFEVRLPVMVAEQPLEPGREAGGQARPAARRILVVDDNWDAAESLGRLLQMSGNEVRTAHDGLEAVAAAADFRPDVVFLDIGLPKLNGYEAARRIREQDGGGAVLLVALTGWGQEEDRRRSREAGFNRHLTKPVVFSVLQDLIGEAATDR